MTDITFTDVGEEWTYEKRRGWLNIDGVPAKKGAYPGRVFKFNTKYGLPTMVPDQWNETTPTEKIPDDIAAIQITGGGTVKLWVDDIRKPPDETWAWARENSVAREILENYEVLECSLDHDMGHHDRDPDDEDSIYLRGDAEDDGYQLAKWMVENNKVPQAVAIHSWNPVGAKRMANLLRPHCLSCKVEPYQVPQKHLPVEIPYGKTEKL